MAAREQILHMLAEAAEMEHNLLCSYLYAAFSLKENSEGLSPDEAAAVSGWRRSVLDVAVQEMGHFVTVNNLAMGLGGAPHLDRPNFPVARGYHPSGFELRLAPFDEATLEHFMFLERPEDAALEDAEAFDDAHETPRQGGARGLTPSARDYETIGDLYRSIRRDICALASERSGHVFVGTEGQVSGADMGMKNIVVIGDLPTALAALQYVIEQGEGGRAGSAGSHFSRFCAIREQ